MGPLERHRFVCSRLYDVMEFWTIKKERMAFCGTGDFDKLMRQDSPPLTINHDKDHIGADFLLPTFVTVS